MTHVNFIFAEIIVSDNKNWRHYFHNALAEVLLLEIWGLQYRVHFVFAQTNYCNVSK
jgi:hypothetical protein